MVEQIKTLEYKIKDTNTRLVSARDTLDEALATCNLKFESKTLYLEELLIKLKHGLYDTLSTI